MSFTSSNIQERCHGVKRFLRKVLTPADATILEVGMKSITTRKGVTTIPFFRVGVPAPALTELWELLTR